MLYKLNAKNQARTKQNSHVEDSCIWTGIEPKAHPPPTGEKDTFDSKTIGKTDIIRKTYVQSKLKIDT